MCWGSGGTLAGDLMPASTEGGCSASTLAYYGTSCVGGLMGLAAPQWNYSAPQATCTFSAPAPDTLWIVNPATGQPPSAEQLQALTSAGPITPEFTPSIDTTSTAPGAASFCNADRPGPLPLAFMAGCASTLKIDVTIARDWTTGLAASAKSGDMAVLRSPATIDVFAEDNYSSLSQGAPHEHEQPDPALLGRWQRSFQSEIEGTATNTLVESLEAQAVQSVHGSRSRQPKPEQH